MTLQEGFNTVRQAGSIQVENGRVKLRFPELAVLRANRAAIIEQGLCWAPRCPSAGNERNKYLPRPAETARRNY
jgi:hypothetical protein